MNQHLSSEQISRWIAGERSPREERHARECPQCRAELERLENAFSLFRDSGRRWSDHWFASPAERSPLRSRRRASLGWASALAATLLLAALMMQRPWPGPPHSAEKPFLEIPYVAPLAPYERTSVVRMDVPVAALIAAGFVVHAPDAAATVEADVLFGQE